MHRLLSMISRGLHVHTENDFFNLFNSSVVESQFGTYMGNSANTRTSPFYLNTRPLDRVLQRTLG